MLLRHNPWRIRYNVGSKPSGICQIGKSCASCHEMASDDSYIYVCVRARSRIDHKIQHPVLATFMSASLFRGSQEYVVIKSDLLCLSLYSLIWDFFGILRHLQI